MPEATAGTNKGEGMTQADDALRGARTYAESIVDTVREPLVVLDADLRVLSVNRSFCQTFQVSPEETENCLIYEIGNHQWDIPSLRAPLEEILPKNTSFHDFEVDHEFPTIGQKVMLVNARRIYREGNRAMMILLAIEDITERKRAEEALQVSETQYRRLFETAPDGILLLNVDTGQIIDSNPFVADLLGRSREEVVGKKLWEIGVFADTVACKKAFSVLQSQGYIRYENLPLEAKDGQRLDVEFISKVYEGDHGSVIQCNIRDMSGQKRAMDLRRLAARLLEVQEEDRRKVAYDIHDGLGQLITAAAMHLEASEGHRQSFRLPEADTEFEKGRRCLQDAVVEMRRMVSELGPLLLEDLGLVEASRRLLADVAELANWETEFEEDVNDERLDRTVETALFRIVQEALANARKHAQTRKVRVSFQQEGDSLRLEVRDWGQGFDVEEVLAQAEHGRHIGLASMRERAALIGGQFHIEGSPGSGTRLAVVVPVAPAAESATTHEEPEVMDMAGPAKARESARQEITVLIVDDHPMVREGLRSMLDMEGIEVVGEAGSGAEALEKVWQLNPDVVLMDVRMPDMDGLAATEAVKRDAPATSVIVLTAYESKEYLRRAIEAGAAGYMLKGMTRDSLLDAIRLVKAGGSLVDTRLLSELLREMGIGGSCIEGAAEGTLEALSPRERQVLQLLVQGLTNKEIAQQMHYSVGTVKNAVQRVIEKLGVSDRTQAAVCAVRAGLNLA